MSSVDGWMASLNGGCPGAWGRERRFPHPQGIPVFLLHPNGLLPLGEGHSGKLRKKGKGGGQDKPSAPLSAPWRGRGAGPWSAVARSSRAPPPFGRPPLPSRRPQPLSAPPHPHRKTKGHVSWLWGVGRGRTPLKGRGALGRLGAGWMEWRRPQILLSPIARHSPLPRASGGQSPGR